MNQLVGMLGVPTIDDPLLSSRYVLGGVSLPTMCPSGNWYEYKPKLELY